jgi:hypothetical protein
LAAAAEYNTIQLNRIEIEYSKITAWGAQEVAELIAILQTCNAMLFC